MDSNHRYVENATLLEWLIDEVNYADEKRPDRTNDDAALREAAPGLVSPWEMDVLMYLQRSRVLGYDNPLGRQALGKALSTLFAMVKGVAREFGELPPAGLPSGRTDPDAE
mgnify:CR=1 FL=1